MLVNEYASEKPVNGKEDNIELQDMSVDEAQSPVVRDATDPDSSNSPFGSIGDQSL